MCSRLCGPALKWLLREGFCPPFCLPKSSRRGHIAPCRGSLYRVEENSDADLVWDHPQEGAALCI